MLRQAIGLVVCLLIVTSSRVSADVVTFNGNGQPISITGLSIPNESLLFDVTFTYNTSFNSLFGPGNPTPSGQVPYFWGNQTQAFAAGNAIRDAVLSDANYNINSSFLVAVPFTIFFSGVHQDDITNSASFVHTGSFKGTNSFVGLGGFGPNSQAPGPLNGWAQFTAVPEPSSGLLFVALGLWVSARRTGRIRINSAQ
jgi:hypothetical protein